MNPNASHKEIVLFGINSRYLQARKDVAARGMRLPPHPLLDDYVQKNFVPALWADEMLVHPEKDGVFQNGRDAKDSLTGWILPASYVPKEAVGKMGAGLFVVPEDVREEAGKVIVHAKSVIILNAVTNVYKEWVPGKPQDATKIPLVVPAGEFECLPENEKRWLYRIAGEGVRPLYRSNDVIWRKWGKQNVVAICGEYDELGVAGVPI